VLETLTTTGFGSQELNSPVTQLWVILLMGIGVVLIAGLLTSLVHHLSRPYIERHPPVRAPQRLRDHLLIIGAGPMGRYLAQACQRSGLPYRLLDGDPQRLQQALQQGFLTIGGDPASPRTLQGARLHQAHALVLTERDGLNLTLLMQVQALGLQVPSFATQEELPPVLFKQAGVTGLVSAKRLLGERLGQLALGAHGKAFAQLDRQVAGLCWATVPVLPGSDLAGAPLPARLGGALTLGVITRGVVLPTPQATQPLLPGDLLLVTGRAEAIEPLRQRFHARPFQPEEGRGPVLLLGAGNVGRTAAAYLKAQGIPVWVLDRRPLPPGWQVDRFTLGDAGQAADLRRAGVGAVPQGIIALPDDEVATVATLTLARLNGPARLLCRANQVDSVAPLYRAGAGAVVSLPEVGGAALARLAMPAGVRLPAPSELVARAIPVPDAGGGRSVQQLNLPGAVCVAVERPCGTVEFAPEARAPLAAGDRLLLFGDRLAMEA
jgi:Trk K+ transport system NAD-binding subunit